MVETVSQSTFNFSSEFTPSFSFASTMRTCYANNKALSINSSESSNSSTSDSVNTTDSSNSSNLKALSLETRRSSCGESYLRNYDHDNCNNKRCSNTITTTCLKPSKSTKNPNTPKLQLTTTTFEDAENNLLSSCTTQLSTPQSNGMISHKQQFNYESSPHLGQHSNRMSTSGAKQKRSESVGFFRQCSELSDQNNNLLTSSFDDAHENSNSSEDDLVFAGELSSSPSQHQHNYQPKSSRQLGNNGAFVLCKRCGGSNSSLTSFSSVSSVSSNSNLNQHTLTNNNCPQNSLNSQDNLINNLSHSLNQTFNLTNNNLTPQYGRSRHNSINSLTLNSNNQRADRNLHALHKALHHIFSN